MPLVYIHGFNSSPASLKARQTAAWLQKNCPAVSFVCPALASDPARAIAQLQLEVEKTGGPVGLVGSSMGGYYATWLAEKYRLKAVLINPAVKPYDLMVDYLGVNANYHTGERYHLEQCHVNAVKDLEVPVLQNLANYWVLLQTGDEVLNYRLAESRYNGCRVTIEQGGDHSFQHYERHLPAIIEFLGLATGVS
ncbi:YqiA/YcfP family alpha/beta fold hydrolase [Porticoccus sp.]|uniref:YqiA/YcfP family alpha/beta fold hydrolase n=1 Tax=Porticoccus sp. TaxID=2024853 RepID=UPI003F69A487